VLGFSLRGFFSLFKAFRLGLFRSVVSGLSFYARSPNSCPDFPYKPVLGSDSMPFSFVRLLAFSVVYRCGWPLLAGLIVPCPISPGLSPRALLAADVLRSLDRAPPGRPRPAVCIGSIHEKVQLCVTSLLTSPTEQKRAPSRISPVATGRGDSCRKGSQSPAEGTLRVVSVALPFVLPTAPCPPSPTRSVPHGYPQGRAYPPDG